MSRKRSRVVGALATAVLVCNCNAQVRWGDSVVFERLVGQYKHLGNQSGSVENSQAVVIDEAMMERLCAFFSGDESERGVAESLNGKTVILGPNVDETCDGDIGVWADFLYLNEWCSLNTTAIIQAYEYDFPSIEANAHDGTKFEAFGSFKTTCNWFATRTSDGSEEFLELFRGNLTGAQVSWTLQENEALRVFALPIVQIIWRGVIPASYLLIVVLSLRYLYLRFRLPLAPSGKRWKNLTNVQGFILLMNACTFLPMTVAKVLGTNYCSDLLPLSATLAFYTEFFGTGVCLNWCLAIVFEDLWSKFNKPSKKTRLMKRWKLYTAVAGALLVMELAAIILTTNLTTRTYFVAIYGIPSFFVVSQVIVIMFFSFQTLRVISNIRSITSSAGAARSTSSSKEVKGSKVESKEDGDSTHPGTTVFTSASSSPKVPSTSVSLLQAYEERFLWWLKIAVGFAAMNVILLTMIGLFFLDLISPQAYVTIFTLIFVSRAGNALAQIKICQPIVKVKPPSHDGAATGKNHVMEEEKDAATQRGFSSLAVVGTTSTGQRAFTDLEGETVEIKSHPLGY